MIILGIETSCDETAISLIEASGTLKSGVKIAVLADKTLSQIALHQQYGGVFPSMAKREHAKNLLPLFRKILEEASFSDLRFPPKADPPLAEKIRKNQELTYLQLTTCNLQLATILEREPELLKQFLEFIPTISKPPACHIRNRGDSQRDFVSNGIDLIAVTEGPGLEPCLWTGLNFARALSLVFDIPVVPVNHMEGHIISALMSRNEISNDQFPISKQIRNSKSEILNAKRYMLNAPTFPAVALLISGGHTELVLIRDYFKYKIIGATRDDAVGEAFDKVARILGLPYPGGPPISALAEMARTNAPACRQGRDLTPTNAEKIKLPRPMIKNENLDFSFAGLKTAVLYLVQKLTRTDQSSVREVSRPVSISPRVQSLIAQEFEDAVTDVLIAKTKRAIEKYNCKTLLIGGGVIANTHIRRAFEAVAFAYGRTQIPRNEFLRVPEQNLTTDNALMIAVAGYLRYSLKDGSAKPKIEKITAKGNLMLDEE